MKNNENVILGQKVVFCDPKKTMMPTESHRDLFTRDIRVVRSSIAGSFSLAGEGHRKRGRFSVELPIGQMIAPVITSTSSIHVISTNEISYGGNVFPSGVGVLIHRAVDVIIAENSH